MFAALLAAAMLAASSPCDGDFAPLDVAQAHLQDAQAALARHDATFAKTSYDLAMQQLGAAPWTIDDRACDPPKYTFRKLTLLERSLVVAVNGGWMDAIEASDHDLKMSSGVMPGPMALRFPLQYPDLADQYNDARNALKTAWRNEQIALHSPSTLTCAQPNLEAVMLDQSLDADMVVGSVPKGVKRLHALAAVHLNEFGVPTTVAVAQSSGNAGFDRAAMMLARAAKYLPKISGCRRVPSTYLYVLDYVWPP